MNEFLKVLGVRPFANPGQDRCLALRQKEPIEGAMTGLAVEFRDQQSSGVCGLKLFSAKPLIRRDHDAVCGKCVRGMEEQRQNEAQRSKTLHSNSPIVR